MSLSDVELIVKHAYVSWLCYVVAFKHAWKGLWGDDIKLVNEWLNERDELLLVLFKKISSVGARQPFVSEMLR